MAKKFSLPLSKIIILALILRLLVAPFFYHPDLKSQHFHFQFLSHGVSNIYQYISTNKDSLPYRDTFNYLPLTYFSLGAYHALLKPLFPKNLSVWLNDWSAAQNSYDNFPFFMLILKLPYFLFDIGISFILLKLYGQKIFYLWLFNPLNLYLIYILGNFDIIPVFFTALSWYFLKSSSKYLSFLTLGIATALKLYPLLLLPFFLLYKPKNTLKSLLFFFLPLILTVLPFVDSQPFINSLTSSGLSQKIIGFKIWYLPVFPIVYLLVLLNFLRHRHLEKTLLYVFLAFIVFVDFHAQWLLWFLPFILFSIVKNKTRFILFIIISVLSFFYIILMDDSFLFWGHLTPVSPAFVFLRRPDEIFRYRFLTDPYLIQKYIKILLALFSFCLIFSKNEKI